MSNDDFLEPKDMLVCGAIYSLKKIKFDNASGYILVMYSNSGEHCLKTAMGFDIHYIDDMIELFTQAKKLY